MKNWVLVILVIASLPAWSQLYFNTAASRSELGIKVVSEEKEVLKYPWAGGMNSCQFNEVDIDLDGDMDLLVFDRNGDRLMPFINEGGPDPYVFAPEFIPIFPELKKWFICRDYDMDGKNDIFAYAIDYPGIIVYRNISETNLAFELVVTPYLTSYQGGGEVNILTTDVDFPAIDDLDGDGDLDILSFWGLGSFVEYHQNQSMELYGHRDSLRFIEVTQCWGRFAENEESNILYLDTCMDKSAVQNSQLPDAKSRHTGSTFLSLDLDGDDDKDLLLGDVDFPDLIQLINGGSSEEAFMVSQDEDFPSYNKPVNLFAMPVAAYLDVDNDEINELLLSPFDPGLETSANKRSSWIYENNGANNNPDFDFIQADFLQDDMIDVGSGSVPVMADANGDGLTDLFIANFGYYIYSYYQPGMFLKSVYWSNIALYLNTGNLQNPEFTRLSSDFADLHKLHQTAFFPVFADLDDDNDLDMVCGLQTGELIYFENNAGPGQLMSFDEPVTKFQDIDVGDFSAPQLYDLDKDGLVDLIIGEAAGNLNYYRNTGSATNPQFVFVTDSLGKINVTDPNLSYTGFSTPHFFELNDETRLLVGSESGEVFYYKNVDGNISGSYEMIDSLVFLVNDESIEMNHGIRTAVALTDINFDGINDLFVGNYSGGLSFFSGQGTPGVNAIADHSSEEPKLIMYPNPASEYLFIEIHSRNIQDCLLEIRNLDGQLIRDYKPNERIVIIKPNNEGLVPGIYLIALKQSGTILDSQKLIIR